MQISEARNEQTRPRIKRQNTAIIHQRRGGERKERGKNSTKSAWCWEAWTRTNVYFQEYDGRVLPCNIVKIVKNRGAFFYEFSSGKLSLG